MRANQIVINIRTELFDQGIFPATSTNFTMANVSSIVKTLMASSTVEYKITLQQFCDEITKKIPGISVKVAEIYFTTFKIICGDYETLVSGSLTKQSKQSVSSPEKCVDMRLFALYLGVQLFSQSLKISSESRKNMSNTPWPGVITRMYINNLGIKSHGPSSRVSKSQIEGYQNPIYVQ
jgi:hypothetical protein